MLVPPIANGTLDMAAGLRLPDGALDERGLGFPPHSDGHLKRYD